MSERTQAESFLLLLDQNDWTLATAESCTGGLLASSITDIPGASNVFLGGFVTYSNEMKEDILGIPKQLIKEHGGVSQVVAEQMAISVREKTGADIGLATTGVAGPDRLEGKPPGTVFIALAYGKESRCRGLILSGSRGKIRSKTVQEIVSLALEVLPGQSI